MNEKDKKRGLNRLTVRSLVHLKEDPCNYSFDNIRSLNQYCGSVFQNFGCLRIEKIYLCGIQQLHAHREIQSKNALGATEVVDWEYWKPTTRPIEKCREKE